MTTPPDSDLLLESLNDEMRAQMAALNDLHHPVYPAGPKRIAELERRVAELRIAIGDRRRALAGIAPA
jgi:hypothetical protein